jgi:hypothetical protein
MSQRARDIELPRGSERFRRVVSRAVVSSRSALLPATCIAGCRDPNHWRRYLCGITLVEQSGPERTEDVSATDERPHCHIRGQRWRGSLPRNRYVRAI